ncbi:hypothetical protein BDF22DRAFT_775152 [Syncephalis plumigaleata]|nr:hypothetical protein BDF22DRAFT_775152 [Syncephalis plumigaleata]
MLLPTYSQIHQWYHISNLGISNASSCITQPGQLSSNRTASAQPLIHASSLQRIATPEEQRQLILDANTDNADNVWRMSDILHDPLDLPVNYPETPVNLMLGEDGELHEVDEASTVVTPLVDAGLQDVLLPMASPFVHSSHDHEFYNAMQFDPLFNQSTIEEVINTDVIQGFIPQQQDQDQEQEQQEQGGHRHRRQRQRHFNWLTWLDGSIELDANQLFSSSSNLAQHDDITLCVTRQRKSTKSTIMYNDEMNALWEVNMQMMLQPQVEDVPLTRHSMPHEPALDYSLHAPSEEYVMDPPDDPEQMRGHNSVIDRNIDPILAFGTRMPWDPMDDIQLPGTVANSEHTDRLAGLSAAMMGGWTTATTTPSMPGGVRQPSDSLRQPWRYANSETGSLGIHPTMGQLLVMSDQSPSSVLSGGLPLIEANRTRSLFPNQESLLLPIQHQDTENFYRYLCRIAVHTGYCLSFQRDILPTREMTRSMAAQGLYHLLLLANTRRVIVWQNNSMEDIMVDLVVTAI